MVYTLSNDTIAITVRPDLGARIDQIVDLETGKQWLWHPEGYEGAGRTLEIGASFDDNWTGGWDEIFPNDAACSFQDRDLADHGELWSQPWHVKADSPRSITLRYWCRTVPVNVEKIVSLEREGVKVTYRYENLSGQSLPFLFKLHPALAIEPGDEILLPPCEIEPVDTGFSTLIGKPGRTPFPMARDSSGKEIRVNTVPPRDARKQEFFYATGLCEGWCALRNTRTNRALSVRFSTGDLPYVWVFQSYGQWRDHYVLMLEPCTNIPWDLETALKNGTCAVLETGEQKELTVYALLEKAGGAK